MSGHSVWPVEYVDGYADPVYMNGTLPDLNRRFASVIASDPIGWRLAQLRQRLMRVNELLVVLEDVPLPELVPISQPQIAASAA